jgi:orotidine-5'-phosphate decarboxylase
MTTQLPSAQDRIIVALDVNMPERALELVELLEPEVGGFKVGFEFFTSTYVGMVMRGVERSERIRRLDLLTELYDRIGDKLFWDGKWNDVSRTVGGAATGLSGLQPLYANVHASSGRESLEAACAALQGITNVLGMTVLSSLKPEEVVSIFGKKPNLKVKQFAQMTLVAGGQGIVCSTQELEYLAKFKALAPLERIVPGIRSKGVDTDDQNRVGTPGWAIQLGATRLVIGSQIITNEQPVHAARLVVEEIEEAEAQMVA